MRGNRIPLTDDSIDPYTLVKSPGDYYGPVMGFSGDKPAVFFIPPKNLGEPRLHHICSPPHKFKEESDGTLTISDSIGCGPTDNYYYHGYLENGNWRDA